MTVAPHASDTHIGRTIGLLVLLHFFGGLILPYVLLDSAMTSAGTTIVVAAGGAVRVRTAVLLFMTAAGLVLGIALTTWPVFRERGGRLALVFVALAIANLPLQLVESGAVMTILSLSERIAANPGDVAPLHAAGLAAVYARRWAHFTQLLTVVSWLFVLYLTLWRTRLVPRLLAGLGMVTTVMQIAGVPVQAFLGRELQMLFAMPLAPVHLTLAVWLIVKGLRALPPKPALSAA